MKRGLIRQRRGAAIIVVSLFITVILLLTIGLFSYEINRLNSARQQLSACCDAAALAGAATLASQDNVDPVEAHTLAIQTALSTFQNNTLIGVSLASAVLGGAEDVPPSNQASVHIEFLDPNNNDAPVDNGNPAGKKMKITASFGLEPAFGTFLGLSSLPVRMTSTGGVPDLDVVLCFDISGSIDDQTPVTFVKRQWTTTGGGRNQYTVTSTRAGSPAGALAQGRMYDILGPALTGTRCNALYPQYLSVAAQSDHRYGLWFSERYSARDPGYAPGLRGTTNAGSRPGNYSGGGTGASYTFTDLVVNIDGRNTFGGITTPDGYSFPDLATVVEAARGNLENTTVFTSSGANVSVPASVAPRAGYQARYFQLAAENVHPLRDAQLAASDFFTIMNTNTVGHFGLISFADSTGTTADTTYSADNVDQYYRTAGGVGTFPVPNVALNPAAGATNYDTIVEKLPTTVATTATNIGEAVLSAVDQLNTHSRPGAKKAIILFTDGMPTQPTASSPEPWGYARSAAVAAKDAGIAIYTIGLAQNAEIVPYETEILNDTNADTSTGGMAAIAGNGGRFFLITDAANLRATFENIARHLVALVK